MRYQRVQCIVAAHSHGSMARRGASLQEYLDQVTIGFIALARTLHKEGIKLAVATHSCASEYESKQRSEEEYIIGEELVERVLQASVPELAGEFAVVAYNPSSVHSLQQKDKRGQEEQTSLNPRDAHKKLHIRRIAEHFLVDTKDIVLLDDDDDNVCDTDGEFRAIQVEPSTGLLLEPLLNDLVATTRSSISSAGYVPYSAGNNSSNSSSSNSRSSISNAGGAGAYSGSATIGGGVETIMEGWGGKQGRHYPTWKLRWFVLQRVSSNKGDNSSNGNSPNSVDDEDYEDDDTADTREYFSNHCPDMTARSHNYNVMNDKQSLVLSYFVDESKTVLREEFRFTEDTCWKAQRSRITCPEYDGTPLQSLHVFCKGSRGSQKLIFIPFGGFASPSWERVLEPWQLAFEFCVPRAANLFYGSYFDDSQRTCEHVPGRSQEHWEACLDRFEGLLADEVVFKEHKDSLLLGAATFIPLVVLRKHAQADDKALDKADVAECLQQQREWLSKFENKKMELRRQKQQSGSRELWLKYRAQAAHVGVTFSKWMIMKDSEEGIAQLPEDLR